MGMLKEFKDFAIKGNVIDMAVGIVIGGAFLTIVNSLVRDVINPPLGLLTGRLDFSDLAFTLSEGAGPDKAVVIKYGMFITAVINFLISAFAVFIIIKQINRLKKPEAPAAPTTKDCPHCLMAVPLQATKCGHCTSELK